MRNNHNNPFAIRHIKIWVLIALLTSPVSAIALPTLPDAGNLLHWFSADTNVTPATDGADVTGWTDQTVGLNIAPPAPMSSARSPSYVTNGINNLPSLDFRIDDGGIDALQNPSVTPSSVVNSLFIVFQPENEITTIDPAQLLMHTSTGTGESVGLGGFHNGALPGAVIGTISKTSGGATRYTGYGTARLVAGQPHVFGAVYNSVNQRFDLYLDGISIGNLYGSADDAGLLMDQLVVGANVFATFFGFEGMISEIILYQSSLSDADRISVEDYLSNKYLVQTANMAFWFTADTGVWADVAGTVPISDGVDVQLWKDQSGNDVDLVPSHPGFNRAATYVDDGINGQPALQFNNETSPGESSPDKMQNTGYSGTLKTLFYVFQPDQAIENSLDFTQRQVLLTGGSEINTVSPHNQVSSAHIGLNSSDGTANRAWGYDPADDLDIPAYPTVLSVSWHDTDDQYDIRINGVSVGNLTSGADPNAFVLNGLYLGAHNGGAYGLQGKLAEVIAYDAELPVAQRNAIEQYLKGKYAAPNTYYVDATSGLDTNDGWSPGTAWKSLARVEKGFLIPGDTVLLKRGETWREEITIPASGAPGLPITYRAYGAGDRPIIHGGRPGTTWEGPVNNVYSMNGLPGVYFMAENDELIEYASDSSCADGNWFRDGTEETLILKTGALYYKPTTGVFDPSVVEVVTTYKAMNIVSKSYIEFYDLAFTLASRGISASGSPAGPVHHITIANSEFTKMENGVFFESPDGNENSDSIISANTFSNIRHSIGVYAVGSSIGTSRNFLITGNTILNGGIAADPQLWNDIQVKDDDGIGFQNVSDSVVSHNRIIDGTGIRVGIGMWVNPASTGKNNQYIYNYLENILGTGFVPSGAYNSGGHTVAYNVVVDSGRIPHPDAPGTKGWGGIRLNTPQNPASKIYNNLLVGNDINIYFHSGPDNYQTFNNISYDPDLYHIFLIGPIGSNTLDNNLYSPDFPQGFSHHVFGPWDLQGWVAYTAQDNPNLATNDPGFLNIQTPPFDFRLTAGSPAIDPVLDVRTVLGLGNSYLDYDDQYMVWNPDIGPYEYQETDTDADGVRDIDEICFDGDCTNYDPYDPVNSPAGGDLNAFSTDTDGDGYRDGTEITLGSDPLDAGSTPTITADGDVNLDGQVNVADILLTQRSVLGLTTLTAEQIAHGDYRPVPGGDGQLGLSDLILIVQAALL